MKLCNCSGSFELRGLILQAAPLINQRGDDRCAYQQETKQYEDCTLNFFLNLASDILRDFESRYEWQ